MIHVWDQDFVQKVEATFHEAYMTHTSTSPNYQILASLDLGRRQAALEGFELVQKQVEYAMSLRDAVDNHPSARHTSNPDIPGSIRSRMTTSGGSASARASARSPSPTTSTDRPSRSRYRRTTSLTVASSSTTSTRAGPAGAVSTALDGTTSDRAGPRTVRLRLGAVQNGLLQVEGALHPAQCRVAD